MRCFCANRSGIVNRKSIVAALLLGFSSYATAADSALLVGGSVRLAVNRETALPDSLSLSDRNWLPDLAAELECSDVCKLQTVEEQQGAVRTVWATESQKRVWVDYVQTERGFDLRVTSDTELRVTLRLPLDPFLSSITFLSSARNSEGRPILPGVLSAPDFGQIAVEAEGGDVVTRMLGSRDRHRLTWTLEFVLKPAETTIAHFSAAATLDIQGVGTDLLDGSKPYWWNIFTTRAEDDPRIETNPLPVHRLQQMLANNTLSDPVSVAFFNIADMALPVKNSHPVSLMRIVQDSLTWWLEHQVEDRGVAIGYGTYSTFLDSNPSLLITAWDVIEATDDIEWLRAHIRCLETLGNYLAERDIDGDGIVEAELPGTPNSLLDPGRSSNWIDAINFGYKDAFANALVYRAWLCLADLENRLGNRSLASFYQQLAVRLKENYSRVFYDPGTRMLAGWVDAKGRRPRYRFPGVNGLAVSVGLIDPADSRRIMQQVANDIAVAGFSRYDLGVPLTLDPIEPFDYLAPAGLGYPNPTLPDRNWQHYENGGVTPTQTAYYLHGLIRAGLADEAKRILLAMLQTQAAGGFQNGIVNEYPKGVDWRTWDGIPSGYEGYLNDNYYYLLTAALLDEATYRRIFRPTMQ